MELITPEDPSYEDARLTWNGRFDEVRPQGIARCDSAAGVTEALALAVRERLPVAVRSGGHDFAGRSTGPGLVIDVGPIDDIAAEGGVVSTGAGVRLGDLYEALEPHGITLPGGTCPQVGVTGLALGGGLGPLGRTHGLLADRMRSAEVVLADGRTVSCDEHRHPDLFWALRGGGAVGLGVVTRLTFSAVPAPDRVVDIHLAWPAVTMAKLVAAWQKWAPAAPDALAASLKLTVPGANDDARADLYATWFGPREETEPLLRELTAQVPPPTEENFEESTYPESRAFWAGLDSSQGAPRADQSARELGFVKSEFFRGAIDAHSVEAILAATLAERTRGEARELDFMPWGGAYTRRRVDETAFVHRREAFLLKVSASLPLDRERTDDAADRVAKMWEAIRPAGSGRSFQNFADPELSVLSERYYGENFGRLRRIKHHYDPRHVFGREPTGSRLRD